MSPENKQRIIGVLVLLAFIALLIPFLFTSGLKKKQSVSDEIPINAEKRQLIAEQIQGMDNTTAANTAPAPSMPSEQPATSMQPTGLVPDQSEQPQGALPESNQTEPVNTDTNQFGQPVSVPQEATAPNDQEAMNATSMETAAPVKIKSAAKKAIIKKSKKTKTAKMKKEYWSVQIGSFSNQARVQKLIADLHKKGFRVYMQKITTSKGTLTRILVGRETSRAKAIKIAKRIEASMKIKGQIVRKK